MMVIKRFYNTLIKPTSILPLAIFRMAFGFLMSFSTLRFLWFGWVEDCYLKPPFHFTYQFFDWIKPLEPTAMYGLTVLCVISSLCIGLGFFYRIATVVFFLSFTYLELIEKSWYLNHYYFVSLVAFLLIWVPAHHNYSLDTVFLSKNRKTHVPAWIVTIFKLQICVVYLFGGIAKLKPDWLINAQPLKIWLKARTDISYIGGLFEYENVAYLFSWGGIIYDLTIPFLLWSKRSRPVAYILVLIFHILTYILFNIGMFPWVMIAGSMIFITAPEWYSILKKIHFTLEKQQTSNFIYKNNRIAIPLVILFFTFQFTFPFRHYFLSDNVLWTENGIRFAWHVMIMEKNGYTEFTVVDNSTKKHFTIYPSQYLTIIQEKQMSFQPDMIWQFGQYLGTIFKKEGIKDVSVYVNSKVSLNGRPSQDYIDSSVDLLSLKSVDTIYDYIVPLK